MDENEGGGIGGGGGGDSRRRRRSHGRVVRRIEESDVDDVQLFHTNVERLQLPIVAVQGNHLRGGMMKDMMEVAVRIF